MNWNLAVEKNHEALRRILAMLVAMVAMTAGDAEPGNGSHSATLPRHLHRFVLRLLRPAEAATRRLIIVAARGLVVKLPQFRPRKPTPEPRIVYVLDRVNGSIVSVPIVMRGAINIPDPPSPVQRASTPSFPLFDPYKRFGVRRRYVKPGAMPQIRLLGEGDPIVPLFRRPEPTPAAAPLPTPDDPLDASSIHRRLGAIGRALEDLPGHAQRMARWQARRDARLAAERAVTSPPSVLPDVSPTRGEISGFGATAKEQHRVPNGGGARRCQCSASAKRRFHRITPMRPGRPPGWRRKPNHDVYEVLNELQGLAVWASERRDSS